MNIDKNITDRIKSINWFSNCGNETLLNTDFKIRSIVSWREAKKHYTNNAWEEKTLEERNKLTSFLSNNYRNEYSNWNNIVKEAKIFIEEEIVPKIKMVEEKYELGETFLDCIKWDILGAIMENEFKKCKGVPFFSLKLLDIYEAGNFPCGWDGTVTEGMLIVY